MVDSIRQPARIGVVTPSGALRPLERRRQPQQDKGNARDEDPQGAREEEHSAREDRDAAGAEKMCTPPSRQEEKEDARPGRCIDVRI